MWEDYYGNDTALCCILQIQDVYITTYETCGQYWPYIHHYTLVAIVIMQITMIGLFGLKSKPAASFCTVPLLVLTLLFNEYCKTRFLPTFYQFSVKVERIFTTFMLSFITSVFLSRRRYPTFRREFFVCRMQGTGTILMKKRTWWNPTYKTPSRHTVLRVCAHWTLKKGNRVRCSH